VLDRLRAAEERIIGRTLVIEKLKTKTKKKQSKTREEIIKSKKEKIKKKK